MWRANAILGVGACACRAVSSMHAAISRGFDCAHLGLPLLAAAQGFLLDKWCVPRKGFNRVECASCDSIMGSLGRSSRA